VNENFIEGIHEPRTAGRRLPKAVEKVPRERYTKGTGGDARAPIKGRAAPDQEKAIICTKCRAYPCQTNASNSGRVAEKERKG